MLGQLKHRNTLRLRARIGSGALIALMGLTGCDAPAPQTVTFVRPGTSQAVPVSVVAPTAPRGPAVDEFAIRFLNSIQAQSIAARREFCGYIFATPSGTLQATPPRAGGFANCDMPLPGGGQGIIASYHTHGAFGAAYDNEVPSSTDLQADFQSGLNGYVSTPGGRVWLVDYQTRSTYQLCGRGCVTSDPNYRPTQENGIRSSYTLPDLQQRAGQF